VAWTAAPFESDGARWPAGTIVVTEAERDAIDTIGVDLGLIFRTLDAPPPVRLNRLAVPRIGVYQGFTGNMPEGWTRWILERYEFPYETLTNARIRAGDLTDLDVIVLPDQEALSILNGHLPGTMPPEYVGGLGASGTAALTRFVEGGGWLVAIDQAADFAIEQFGLPIRNTVAERRSDEFFIPGSLVRIEVNADTPLTFGMPEAGIAFFVRSQVFEVVPPASAGDRQADQDVDVLARYAREDFLASGWAHGGERYLAGRVAAVRVPVGRGQVVLHAFEPAFRAQPHGTFKLFFNPLLASTIDEPLWSGDAR
jgi:hypothetical protein